jgi:hypothetical protein
MDELRPGSMLATGIPGGLALAGVPYVTGWLQDCLLVIGVVLCCFAVVILFFWARDQWISQTRFLLDGRDRLLKHMQQAQQLTSEQLNFVERSTHIGIDVTLQGESYLRGTDAPLWFVDKFLGLSSLYSLARVRQWSEGSKQHEWADQITARLVEAGFALDATGNQPASWAPGITPDLIAKKLGRTLPHPITTPDGWQKVTA